MADYDDKSLARSLVAVPFAVVTASPTPVAIDMLDFGACTFEMFVGAGGITFTGTNRIDWKVEESDDNTNWNFPIDDALIYDPGATTLSGATAAAATGIVSSIIAAHAAADTECKTVGYRGKKRYVRITPIFGGTHGVGTLVGAIARKSYAYHGPVNPLGATLET